MAAEPQGARGAEPADDAQRYGPHSGIVALRAQ
jgi:hypothetical protein